MSNYVVSARKYRPTTFDEVVGQDHIARTLKNALKTDHLAHSFLFCGPRGVGKTTCARILAKVINCENPIDKVTPCNTCSSCKSFNENASFNIIELDAASNNSVDHMRTLIEQVRFQPQHGTHKVFIIDEVHMLSSQAFNAFLKTLEEPPSYAVFILATTEKHKILPTILSRCQIFDFKRIQPEDVVTQLEYILKEEGKTADPEALYLIGQKADGAMRDALSIYDKIVSSSGDHIDYKDVITNLNILDYDYYFKVVDAFLRTDRAGAFLLVDEILRQGFEATQFIQGLGKHIRDLLVCKDERTLPLLEVSDSLKERYRSQAQLCKKSMLMTALDILNQCDINLLRAHNKRLLVEIALLKIIHLPDAIERSLLSEEKKSPEVSTADTTKPKQETRAPQQEKPPVKVKPTPPKPESTPKKAAPTPPVEEKKVPKSPPVKPNPSKLVDINIDGIVNDIKVQEEKIKQARKNLSQEGLENVWKSYTEEHGSPNVKVALQTTIIKLDGKDVKVTVPSQHVKNMVIQETGLIDRLKKQLGTIDLRFIYTVDKSFFPDYEEAKTKVKLTKKDHYNKMVASNPALINLVKRLDLKLKK